MQDNGSHDISDRERHQLWLRRRDHDAEVAGVRAGDGYLYRAGEVLCAVEDEERLRQPMRDLGGREEREGNETLREFKVPWSRWTFDVDAEIPEIVGRLRSLGDEDWQPRVGVNTVFAGEPRYHGGPGGPPRVAGERGPWPEATVSSQRVGPHLGVLDTGYAGDLEKLHAELFDALRPDPPGSDVDELDLDGDGLLDTQAGHGTFICGLVRRVAPDLVIDPQMVLDPSGWGDDRSVTLGLAQQSAGVLNLSFGGYTEDDRPPMALASALRRLGREVVVVAAAGNNGSDRPFWPAAFKGVIAVAAVDDSTDPPRPAAFSNYGPWVDVCAPGVELLSSFVHGSWQLGPGTPVEQFSGWARWSGTSFAAPLVAAEIAARSAATGQSPRRVAAELLASLDLIPGAEDYGVCYRPAKPLRDADGC